MKLSEISRYWAAKELTTIAAADGKITFRAPFAAPRFTIETKASPGPVTHVAGEKKTALKEVRRLLDLTPGTFHRGDSVLTACFDLPKGQSELAIGAQID